MLKGIGPSSFLIIYSHDPEVTELIMGTILVSLNSTEGLCQEWFIFCSFHFYKWTLIIALECI